MTIKANLMIKGSVYALMACFIWGLIFIIPQFMTGFSSIEVALGRYAVYGLASVCLFLLSGIKGYLRFPLTIWMKALFFSLMATFIYYCAVVFSLQYSNPAICTVILGISPVTIAFYANWKERECSFKSLIPSSLCICIGLIIMNIPHFAEEAPETNYILGLGGSVIGLIAWSWFVVANSKFLKDHPHVSSNEWSTLLGVATFIWAILAALVLMVFFREQAIYKHLTHNIFDSRFLMGSAVLGIVCSWCGGYLWNQASLRLPVSLAGQLMIFETLFGLLFVYTLALETPSLIEGLGIALLLGAVLYSVRVANRTFSHYA